MSTYTDDQKAEALDLYEQHGPSEAARRCGIPKGTIGRWASEEGLTGETSRTQKTVAATEARLADAEEKRARLRQLLLEKALDLVGRMDEPHIDFKGKGASEVIYPKATSSDVKNYATSVAILIDKYRLEAGEATSRTEISGTSEVDRELRQTLTEWERQLDHAEH